jgi:hypothetical protein
MAKLTTTFTPSSFSTPASFTTPGRTYRSRSAALAKLLDSQFVVPGTEIRFGLDFVLGLVPGIGDTISAAIGSLIIAEAVQLGVRKPVIAKMAGNMALDWLVGLVPIAGDVFDVMYKSNLRNLELLERELMERNLAKDVAERRGKTPFAAAVA